MSTDIIDSFIVCSDIREEKSGQHTLVGVFNTDIFITPIDEQASLDKPTHLSMLSLYIRLNINAKNLKKVVISIIDPKDAEMVSQNIDIRQSYDGPAVLVIRMGNFPITAFGEFKFVVKAGRKESTRSIRILPGPAPAGTVAA